MNALLDLPCEACHAGAPKVTEELAVTWLAQLPDWQRCERDTQVKLFCCFRFNDFAQALQFTNAVGALAEQHNHHPDLLTRWGAVEVTWYTHAIGGLHQNDFVCAAQTDRLFSQFSAK